MKLRRVTLLAVFAAVIFQATLLAHGQSHQRISRNNQTENEQESARSSRGNLRFSVLATDASPETIKLESKVTDISSVKSRKGNYRTVPRFDAENDKTLSTPAKSDKTYKEVKKRGNKLPTQSTIDGVDIETEPQSVPRPTRQSRSRSLDDATRGGKRRRIITDDEIEPIQGEEVVDEENVTPGNSLRRRPFSRARQGNDAKTTKLELVSSQNDRIENRKSGVRTSLFANRRMDDAANARSQNVVGLRRSPTANNVDVKVKQSSELADKTDEPTNRGSIRGPKNFQRPNQPKKGDAFEVNEDDNYPEEFIKKIKKSSADNVILSLQTKEYFAVGKSRDKVLESQGATPTTESNVIASSFEETSPIPQPRASSRPLLNARRKAINSRVLNNAVTPISSTPSSSTSRSRGELASEPQLRSRNSFRFRTSTLPTLPTASTEESIAQANYLKKNTQTDEYNYLLSQKNNAIDSIPNISSTEKSISRRPTHKARPSYVPKSRVKSTSERSNQIVVPIKPGLRTRPTLPRFNPDTPRPLQPQISTRLRTFAAVTQEYVADVSPTSSPATRRFQTSRSRRPTTSEPISRDDKTFDEEERNISPRLNPRERGSTTERVKFKPRETSTPFKYASELRRNYQKTSTDSEKPEIKTLSQLGAAAPRHRFSSRYRSEQIKSSRSSTPAFVATLPQTVTSPASFTTDYSQNTDLSTETLDIEESTILDTTDGETSSNPTTELSQTFSNKNTDNDADTTTRINTIMAKPDVSNAVYTGKDSKYNNFWSSSTSTTEKVKFRFLTLNISPGTSVETPTQTQTPLETSTTSTTVFRWKPVTDAIKDSDSSEVTTLPNAEQSMTLANLIYKLNETEASKSELSPATTISAFKNIDTTTKTPTTTIQQDGTTEPVMTTTTAKKPITTKKPATTTTKKPATTTTKKPATTTTKKPTTTTTKQSTTTSTTKKPVTTTTTTSSPTTTSATTATTSTKKPPTTTKKPPTTTKKPPTTTKKPVTTTKKSTTTTKKPATTGTTAKKLTATSPTTTKMPTTKSTGATKAIIITPEEENSSTVSSQENKPPDERYIDDILLLNTLLQGGAGPNISPRTGRTQNAQLVLANQIIELALMRAATSTSKPKIATTTENYRDFLKALVSSSQASFLQETAQGPTQKELENFVLNYKDDDVEDVLTTPDNLPKTAIKKPEKSVTPANLGLTNDDILAALIDEQLAGTKAPKKPKPAKKPTTTPAPSGLRYLLQAFSGARNNQPGPIGGLLRQQTSAQDNAPASSQGDGGIPPSTDPGLLNAAINVTRAVSQFMGYVIQGAAESFQNYVRSRTGGFLTNYFNLGVANPS